MLASDWSRGRGWFLTPVGMYNDVQVVNRMYIYIRNQDQSLIWSEKVVLKKISDPPPLQFSVIVVAIHKGLVVVDKSLSDTH